MSNSAQLYTRCLAALNEAVDESSSFRCANKVGNGVDTATQLQSQDPVREQHATVDHFNFSGTT